MSEEKHVPDERRRDGDQPDGGARVEPQDAGEDGRPQVHRPARLLAAHVAAAVGVRRGRVRGGPRLRRLVDPRLAGHLGERHAAHPAGRHGDPRPVHRGADALAPLRDRRPDHARALRPGPAPRSRAAPRQYLRSTGIADTAYFGPESEFFVFDSVALRDAASNRAYYEVDSAEGHWNSGQPGLGYTIRPKEGYFPLSPHDTLHDLRTRDGADARAPRHPVRVPPPRGGDRRPVRDRHALRDADAHGRPGDDLQVRRQEHRARATARRRRSCRSRSSATTARACTATSRSGRTARR